MLSRQVLVYAMELDKDKELRDRQVQYLREHADADADVFVLTHKLTAAIDGLDIKYRLPLLDILIPALKQLSIAQYELFRENLIVLIEMDARVDLLEWCLQKILFNHLDGQFFKLAHTKARYSQAGQLREEIGLILSVMAFAGQ